MLFIYRGDVGAPQNWLGIQEDFTFQPEGQAMCIERISYKYTSELMQISVLSKTSGEIKLSSNSQLNASNLQFKCENTFTSKIEIRNESLKIPFATIELSFNPNSVLPTLSCDGELSADGTKIIWQINNLNYGDFWNCNLEWSLINNSQNIEVMSLQICYTDSNCNEISTGLFYLTNDSCIDVNSQKEIVLLPGETGNINFDIVNNSIESQVIQYLSNVVNINNKTELLSNSSETVQIQVKYEDVFDTVCLKVIDKNLFEKFNCVQIVRIPQSQTDSFQNRNFENTDVQIVNAIFTSPQFLAKNISQLIEKVNTPQGINIPVLPSIADNSNVLSDTGDPKIIYISIIAMCLLVGILLISKNRKIL
jgi:hypothetical protein